KLAESLLDSMPDAPAPVNAEAAKPSSDPAEPTKTPLDSVAELPAPSDPVPEADAAPAESSPLSGSDAAVTDAVPAGYASTTADADAEGDLGREAADGLAAASPRDEAGADAVPAATPDAAPQGDSGQAAAPEAT
ncbi:hypothetical protein P8605_50205, partial [Streptomyces sp. T-3]|nr:hypothetical protein [Streptomyces sp. T-3]